MEDDEANIIAYVCFEVSEKLEETRLLGITSKRKDIAKWKHQKSDTSETNSTDETPACSEDVNIDKSSTRR